MASSVARNAALVGSTQIAKVALALLSLGVLSRLLPPSAIGLFAMTTAVTGIAAVFRDFGLSMAAIQAPTLSKGQRANLFWLNTALGLALFSIAAAVSPLIAVLYRRGDVVPVVIVVATTFVIDGATTQYRVGLIRQGRFGRLSIADIVSQGLGLVVAISLASAGAGVWALALNLVVASATSLLLLILLGPFIPGWPRRNTSTGSFIRFGANLLGVQVLTYVGRNLDNVLLGRFWGATQTGFYARAYNLYSQPQAQAVAPFTDLAVRALVTVLDDPVEYRRRLYRIQHVTAYASLFIFAILVALSGPLVAILLGPGWGETASILRILSIGGLAQMLGNTYYWVFLSQARTGVHLRCVLVSQPVVVGGIVGGLPWGPIGVAWGVTLGMFVEWLIPATYGMAKTSSSGRELLLNLWRPCLAATGLTGAMLLASWASTTWGPVGQVAVGLVAGFAFIGGLAAVWPAFRKDCLEIARIARGVLPRRAGAGAS